MKQKLLYLLLCVMALATTNQARADWNQYDLSSRVKLTSKLSNKDQYFTIVYPEENYVGLYNDGIYNVRISTPDGVVFSKPNPNNSSMTTDGYGYHCLTSTKEVEENSTSAGKDARYRTVNICMKPVNKLSEYQNLTVTIDFDLYIDKTGDNATPKTKYHYSKTFTAKELIAEGMLCPSIQKKAFTYSQDKLTVGCTLSSLPEELTWFTGLMYSDPANNIKDNIVTSKSFDISLGNDEYNTNRTFTVTPLAFRDCNCGGYWFTRYFVSDNSETLTVGRRRLSNLRLTNNANSIQLDWDITAGGSPGGLVTIKRRALGEEDFKVVRTLPDDVTTYYDSSVDPNTFSGTYSITYQGAYDSTPDEKTADVVSIINDKPYWLLSDSVATLCYSVDTIIQHKEVLGLIHDGKSAWADGANRVVIDASMASCPLESANGLFRGLWKVRSIEGMQHLNLQNVTDMSAMFGGCNSLTSLDLSAFNTTNVTDMGGMFSGCNSLTSVDLSAFNTENVTNMIGMFLGCNSLTSLDLSALNTENVTYMSGMFLGCNSLKSVDLSAFNTKNVTDMMSMFDGCSSLTSLDLSAFNTKNVTGMSSMFNGCGSLTSLNLASFSATGENHPDLTEMFNGCSNLKTIYSHSFLWVAGCEGIDTFKGCTSLKGKVSFDSSRPHGDMATFEGYFTPAIKGDLDGDGKLSIGDITRLVKRMSQHGSTYHYQADMNEDGKVTLDDLKLLEERIRTDQPTPAPPTPKGE